MCVHVYVYVCHNACVEVKGQLKGASALLPSCGMQGLNSGPQPWQQVSLSTGSLSGPIRGFKGNSALGGPLGHLQPFQPLSANSKKMIPVMFIFPMDGFQIESA